MNKLSKLACCIIVASTYNTDVTAQERQGLLLNAGTSVVSDNNVLRNNAEQDDTYFLFTPEISYLVNMGKHQFAAKYEGAYSAYLDHDELNYTDHDLALVAKLDHSTKVNTEFAFSYKDEIEEPGSNNSSTDNFTKFNETTKQLASAKLFYGTSKSQGQIVVKYDNSQYRYDNNLQEYRDVDVNRFTGQFFYRIAPKTRMLFQASTADYSYKTVSQFPSQSSTENYYLFGVEWELTAKTSGTFKLGYQEKDFDQEAYNDIDGLSYMLDMTWRPNTFTKIKIGASRTAQESSQLLASAFINEAFSISAEHELTARTKINASYVRDSADITYTIDRTDKRNDLKLGISHSLRTWLDVSLDFRQYDRDSDDSLYDFDVRTINLSFTTNFE